MHAWDRIQSTIDYIEKHLSEEIKPKPLAETAGLSEFYFQRLFHRLVGITVGGYIKKRRLAKAAGLLQSSGQRIIDIALNSGFSSHEVLTRSFKEAFGVSPEAYCSAPARLNHYNKPDLTLNYTVADENVPLVTDQIIIEISRKRLEQEEYFTGFSVEEAIADMPTGRETNRDSSLGSLWDNFHERKNENQALIPGGDEIGVTSMGGKEGYFRYFAGGRADPQKNSGGWESRILPPGDYIICAFEAEDFEHLVMDAIYKAHRYLFEVWLPEHSLTADCFAAERYQSHTPETSKMEIWVRIINSGVAESR